MHKATSKKPTRASWGSVHGVVIKNSLIRDEEGVTADFMTQSGDRVRLRARRASIFEKINYSYLLTRTTLTPLPCVTSPVTTSNL